MRTPHKAGRHPKFSDIQIGDALRASGGVQVLAARALEQASGIPCNRQLVNRAVMRSKALQKICNETLEATLDIAEAQAIAKINEGSEYSIWRFLETRGRHRGYVRRQETRDIDRAGEANELTDAELEEIVRSRAGRRRASEAPKSKEQPPRVVH